MARSPRHHDKDKATNQTTSVAPTPTTSPAIATRSTATVSNSIIIGNNNASGSKNPLTAGTTATTTPIAKAIATRRSSHINAEGSGAGAGAGAGTTPISATRVSTRRRPSISTNSSPVGPLTPPDVPVPDPTTTPHAASASRPQPVAGPSTLPPPLTPLQSHSHTKTFVEPKNHSTRSLGEKDRSACPFPSEYGGSAKCGLADEDAADELLMGVCASIAATGNKALSADEIAHSVYTSGWARPPSAAIDPSVQINASIKRHLRRCALQEPARQPLFEKYQLQGSVNESILQDALHPNAYSGPGRPKGTVWYLATIGPKKWKNPFDGIDMSVLQQPRKIVAAGSSSSGVKKKAPSKLKRMVDRVRTTTRSPLEGTDEGSPSAPSPKPPTLPKILLKIPIRARKSTPETTYDSDDDVDMTSERGSVSTSRKPSRSSSVVARDKMDGPATSYQPSISVPQVKIKKTSQRIRDLLDSSSDSDTSGSELDRPGAALRSYKTGITRNKPPPSPLAAVPSAYMSTYRSVGPFSPFSTFDPLFPSPVSPYAALVPNSQFPPHSPHFPSHSLDNTIWTARSELDLEPTAAMDMETSSSSSDDEVRDLDWGMTSNEGINTQDTGTGKADTVWSAAEDEVKMKEATESLRFLLFPTTGNDDDATYGVSNLDLNQLDNHRPAPSESSSIGESTSASTVTLNPFLIAMKATESASVALAAWSGNTSPIASPHLKHGGLPAALPLPFDASPTQHLTKMRDSFDPSAMDIDEPLWVDESGEGPIRSPDDNFDDHLSAAGESILEPEKQHDLVQWAVNAAASRDHMHMPIKHEIDDYPSPLTTDPEDNTTVLSHTSRASSASAESLSTESHSARSESRESIYQIDSDWERIQGPEGFEIDDHDLACWNTEKTKSPAKAKHKNGFKKAVPSVVRMSPTGVIGVGKSTLHKTEDSPGDMVFSPKTPSKKKKKGKKEAPTPVAEETTSVPSPVPVPVTSVQEAAPSRPVAIVAEGEGEDDHGLHSDSIGPEDFETARQEAEAREEEIRRRLREKDERHSARFETYRRHLQEASPAMSASFDISALHSSASSTFFEAPFSGPGSGSGSSESLHLLTPGNGNLYGHGHGHIQPTPSVTLSPTLVMQSIAGLHLGPSPEWTGSVDPKTLLPASSNFSPYPSGHMVPYPHPSGYPGPFALPHGPAHAHGFPIPGGMPYPVAPGAGLGLPGMPEWEAAQSIPVPIPVAAGSEEHSKMSDSTGSLGSVPVPKLDSSNSGSSTGSLRLKTDKSAVDKADEGMVEDALKPPPHGEGSTISSPLTTAPSSGLNTPTSVKSSTTPTVAAPASAPAPNAGAPPAQTRILRLKPVLDGIDARVVDNIPVYQHTLGRTVVLRRLDSDFVNATNLLNALYVPPAKHADFLLSHPTLRHAHANVPIKCPHGGLYSPGVSGIWVTLNEAKEYGKKLKVKNGKGQVGNILRDDLFQMFAQMAGLKSEHSPAVAFGSPFLTQAGHAAAVLANPPKSSLVSNPANSKSTPNLTALSTTRPATAATASTTPNVATAAKPVLIRPAQTNPDGCPEPKRRRATLVGPPSSAPVPIPTAKGPIPTTAAPVGANRPIAPSPTLPAPAPALGTIRPGSSLIRPPPPTGNATTSATSTTTPGSAGAAAAALVTKKPLAPAPAPAAARPGSSNGTGTGTGTAPNAAPAGANAAVAKRATRASIGGGGGVEAKPKVATG